MPQEKPLSPSVIPSNYTTGAPALTNRKRRELTRFAKFAVIGVGSTLVDIIMLNVFQATILPPQGEHERALVLIASTLSYLMGVVFSFTMNRRWTYPESRPKRLWVQFVQFTSVYLIALIIRALVINGVYPLWGDALGVFTAGSLEPLTANRIASNLAQLTAIGVTLFWNFFANRFWTFQDVP